MAGPVLDRTKVVSYVDAEWLKDENIISTSKFVKQVRALDPEQLEDVEPLLILHRHGKIPFFLPRYLLLTVLLLNFE